MRSASPQSISFALRRLQDFLLLQQTRSEDERAQAGRLLFEAVGLPQERRLQLAKGISETVRLSEDGRELPPLLLGVLLGLSMAEYDLSVEGGADG